MGNAVPPSPWCAHTHAHTRHPHQRGQGCGIVLACHPPSHARGPAPWAVAGGQGTVSYSMGKEDWPHGSRGKARGVGARRKQACVAQAREQVKMHPQLLGGLGGSTQAALQQRVLSPPPGGGILTPKMECLASLWVRMLPQSRASRPQDPCGCGGGRCTHGCTGSTGCLSGAPLCHRAVPHREVDIGACPREMWGALAQGCEPGSAPGCVPATPYPRWGLEQP